MRIAIVGNRKINKYNLFYKYTTKGIILDLLGSNYCICLQRKAESMKDKISLNKSEIEKLNTLASDKSVYLRYKNSKMNMIIKETNDPNYKQLYEDSYFTVYERVSV